MAPSASPTTSLLALNASLGAPSQPPGPRFARLIRRASGTAGRATERRRSLAPSPACRITHDRPPPAAAALPRSTIHRGSSHDQTSQARFPKRARSSAGGAFARFELRHELNQAIEAAGYEEPRPIQAKGIPPAMQGRDVLGLAQTGTGKTAAFVLPALHHLLVDRHPALRVLVVTPTRELASQVHGEFERLGQFTPLKSVVIFGGVPASKQIRALRQKPDVVVACPGWLLDLANQGEIKLKDIEILVLDEADHMFDMGFLPDVRRILKLLPKERQNLLFSGHHGQGDPPPRRRRAVQARRHRAGEHAAGGDDRPRARADAGARQAGDPRGAPRRRRLPLGDRLHAHQAPRAAPRQEARHGRLQGHRAPGEHEPGAARARPRRLQGRHLRRDGRDGHRRPRPRHRGRQPRHQLRRADDPRRLHPSHRTHRPLRALGPGVHLRDGHRRQTGARHREASRRSDRAGPHGRARRRRDRRPSLREPGRGQRPSPPRRRDRVAAAGADAPVGVPAGARGRRPAPEVRRVRRSEPSRQGRPEEDGRTLLRRGPRTRGPARASRGRLLPPRRRPASSPRGRGRG